MKHSKTIIGPTSSGTRFFAEQSVQSNCYIRIVLAASVAALLFAEAGFAAPTPYWWDNSNTAGFQVANGTWGGGNALWTTSSSGNIAPVVWAGSGNAAIFDGQNGPYQVSVSGTQNVDSIAFIYSFVNVKSGTALAFGTKNSIYVASGQVDTITTKVTGTGGLTKYGAGTLVFKPIINDNVSLNITGTITVNAGTLTITNSADMYDSIYTTGTVVFGWSGDNYIPKGISGTGGVTFAGTAGTDIYEYDGPNNYSGPTTITIGQLSADDPNVLSPNSAIVMANSANAHIWLDAAVSNNHQTVGSISGGGDIDLASTGGIFTTGNDNTSTQYDGWIHDVGSLKKIGTGTLTLTDGLNSYSGKTTISGGVLSVDSLAVGGLNSCIGTSTNAVANLVLDGGTLQYTGAIAVCDRLFTIGNTNHTATLDASGTGPVCFSNTGAMAYGGTTARTLTLTGTNTDTNTLATVIANSTGATSVTKTGTGTWVLTGANTYTGTTTISGGILQVGNGGTIGTIATSGNIVDNGILVFNRDNQFTYANNITGTGSVVDSDGRGGLTLSGSGSNYSGGTYIGAGDTLFANNSAALGTGAITVAAGPSPYTNLVLGNITMTGMSLTLNSSSTGGLRSYLAVPVGGIATWNGTITLAGDGITALMANGTMTVQGTIGGSCSTTGVRGSGTGTLSAVVSVGSTNFSKTDAGTWTISSTGNTWGNTTISYGTLKLGADGALPATTYVKVGQSGANSATTFDLNGHNQTITGLDEASGQTGAFCQVTDSGAAATLTINNSSDYTYDSLITNTTNALSLTKTGTGTQTLASIRNAYTGVTTITNGTIAVNTLANGGTVSGIGKATNVAGNLVLDGGTLQYSGAAVIIDRLFTVTANGGTIYTSGTGGISFSNAGSISVTGAGTLTFNCGETQAAGRDTLESILGSTAGLTKTGSSILVLSGANTYSGTTTISQGMLWCKAATVLSANSLVQFDAANACTLGLNNNAQTAVNIAGGSSPNAAIVLGSATLTFGDATSKGFSGVISGTGGIFKQGTGDDTLSGSNTFTGVTTAGGGKLTVTTLANGGSPSAIGASTNIASNLLIQSGGALRYTGSGVSCDRLFTIGLNSKLWNSGTGALSMTNTGSLAFSGSGVRRLELGGTYAGASNTFAPIIGDGAGGATSIIKTGASTWILSGTNTCTGADTFQTGILSVSSLANGGVACNLGQANNTAPNLLFDGGTLQYTGGTVSCDRLFSLTNNGGSIDASGSGALSLTNTGAVAYSGTSTRTLTLTGTNTNINTLASVLADNTGATSLAKSGAGTWAVTAANTYSGGTTISAGILYVNNSSGSGTGTGGVTANGGTLGGTGTITGGVTMNSGSTLAPGTVNTQLSTGNLVLTSGSTYSVKFNGATHANTDRVNVTGTVDPGSATLSINLGYAPTIGDKDTIIVNDGGDGMVSSHTFSGLAEGATTTATYSSTTYFFTISYAGGTGNDVVLTNVVKSFTWDTSSVVAGVQAGNGTWDAGVTANWNNGAASVVWPGAGNYAMFGGADRASYVVTVSGTPSVDSINFQYSGYKLTGGTINLTNIGSINTVSNKTDTISSVISGSTGLKAIGSGRLVLTGANTYTGGTTIYAKDTVSANNNTALASGSVVLTASAAPYTDLLLGNGVTMTNAITLNTVSSGSLRSYLTVPAGASATWNGAITLAGDYTAGLWSSGAMTVGGTIGDGSFTGTLQIRGAKTGSGTLSSGAVITIGAATLQKTDTCTWTISSTGNTWGNTNISQGTIKLGVSNAFPAATVVTMSQSGATSAATWDLNGYNQTIAGLTEASGQTGPFCQVTDSGAAATLTINNTSDYTYDSLITETTNHLSVTKTGTGTQTFTRANTYGGTTTISAGILSITNTAGCGTGTIYPNGGTLRILNNGAGSNGTISINNTVTLNSGYTGTIDVENNGANTGNTVVIPTLNNGNNILTFTGANSYNVKITAYIANGTAGTATANPATANLTLGTVTNANAAHTVQLDGTSVMDSVTGIISDGSNTMTIVKDNTGTWFLSGANTYTGGTTISNGNLMIVNSSGSGTGTGSVTANGGTLGGTGTISGSVTMNSGSTLAPGTVNTQLSTGNLTLNSGSTFSVKFNGATHAVGTDRVNVTGTVDPGSATLSISLGYVPSAGDKDTIIQNDGADAMVSSHTFDNLAEGATITASGYKFTISYIGGTGNDVVLTCASVPGPDVYAMWSHSRAIFMNTTTSGSNVLTNQDSFPVLVRLTSSNFDFTQVQSSGQDIRFSKSNGTHMPYQIEQWDKTNQTASIWVRPDTVYGRNASQYFIMYWGNSSALDSSSGAKVFDTTNGFLDVYHLAEDGSITAGSYKDATARAKHATGTAMTSSTDTNALIGMGSKFDGSSQYISLPDSVMNYRSAFSMSGWILRSNTGTQGDVFGQNDCAENWINSGDDWNLWTPSSGNPWTHYGSYIGSWHYITQTGDGSSTVLYIDGSAATSGSGVTAASNHSTYVARIGDQVTSTGHNYFNGKMDEVRFEKTKRSADWIKLCYENQKTNQTLLSLEDYSRWQYSRSINLNTTSGGADVATNQIGFPVLVRLTNSTFNFSQAQDSGQDLRFAKPSGQPLPYQIEQWDRVNQLASIWVNVDTVFGNNGTQYFTMYWGASTGSATASLSNGPGVFDTANGFVGIYHMGEGGTGTRYNSAQNAYNGKPKAYSGNESRPGIIGVADSFYHAGSYDSLGSINLTTAMTLSAWVNLNTYVNYLSIINKNLLPADANDSNEIYALEMENTTDKVAQSTITTTNHTGGAEIWATGVTVLPLNTWAYLTGTYDGANLKYYYNANVDKTSAKTGTLVQKNTSTTIGGNDSSASTLYFRGFVDEPRIENVARSADWIKLCYKNQMQNQTLVDLDDYSKWAYSKNIIINTSATGANTSTACVKFPYLIRLTSSNFNFNQARPDGLDVRFSKANGSHFPYQIERWDKANQVAELWVKVDTVFSNNSTQYIKMAYGNLNAIADTCGQCVFDTSNGFVGVWHLNETSGNALDATIRNYTATKTGSPTQNVTGAIGKGCRFDSTTSDGMYTASGPVSGWPFTISTWVNAGSSSSIRTILFVGDATVTNKYYEAELSGGNTGKIQVKNTTTYNTTGNTAADNTWHYITCVFNGDADKTLFVDNAAGVALTTSVAFAAPSCVSIGYAKMSTPAKYTSGTLDEVRVERTARSADWVLLCYYNQMPTSTITSQGDSADAFRPLSIKRYNGGADSIYIGTNRWAMKFAKNAGGGVKFLAADSASTNQIDKNLFYFVFNGAESDAGNGTLTMLDSSIVFARVRQDITVSSQPFTIDYSVLGSGKMYARVSTYTTSNIGTGLEFRIANNATANYDNIQYGTTAAGCQAVMHVDSGSGKYDLLMVPYDNWTQADQITTNSKYMGISSSTWTLARRSRQTWNFMIDFSHKSLHDSASAWQYINDYRNSDTLGWLTGTPLLEKSWEDMLVGHWKMDENTGDTARDASASLPGAGYYGNVRGGGKWGPGIWGNCDTIDGSDSIKVWPGTVSAFNGRNTGRGFTILGWVKPAVALSTTSVLFQQMTGNSTGYQLTGASGGQLQFTVGNGSTTVSLPGVTILKTGQWYHVGAAFTWAMDTMKLFVNGNLDTMRVGLMSGYPAAGTDSVDMGLGYNGVLDDMRFYGEALTDQQVKAIYLKGFSPNLGMYSVRADNNSQVQCVMHGANVTRNLPVFQIANYWSSNNPPSNVYIDTQLLTNGADYYTALDQGIRTLTVGFNKPVTANSIVYIGNSAMGQSVLTQMPQMYWSKITVGTSDHVWVKNFSGNYFGTAAQKNFFFDWKMTQGNSTNTKNGELWYYASSITNANARLDTTANKNLVPGYDGNNQDLGDILYTRNGTNYPESDQTVAHAFTYSIAESSSVRVQVNLDKRVALSGTDSMYVYTRWTVYPTGQIFRWDSIPLMSHSSTISEVYYGFFLDSLLGGSPSVPMSSPKSKLRFGVTSTTTPDFAAVLTGFKNSGGVVALPFTKDTITATIDPTVVGAEFTDNTTSPNTIWGAIPLQMSAYLDFQRDPISAGYIDSVGCSVKHFPNPALTMVTGSLQKTTWGDINQDGYSEGEGAYVVTASNNSVQFTLLAAAASDTQCRYNPVFRITGYTAATEPQYVLVGPAGSEKLLNKNYGYNVYLNKAKQEVVLQLNQTICVNTDVFISYDRTLAVTMDRFNATPGDANDTLRWRTESEEQNLGFMLYRRIKPSFMDSLVAKAVSAPASDTEGNALVCMRKKLVSKADTAWRLVTTNGIVGGAPQGKSVGPRNYGFVDYQVYNGIQYEYSLEAIDYRLSRSLYKDYANVMPRPNIPTVFDLGGNFPNPFKMATMIRFALPMKTKVNLYVYNLEGRLVRKLLDNEKRNAGFYKVGWDGKDDHSRTVASGPYIYRMTTPAFVKAKIMILAR